MRVLVVGGAIVDFIAQPHSVVQATDNSNEATIRWGAGGAGRNVAENLRRLGCEVTLVTAMADDLLGRFLLENLAGLGIEARVVPKGRTGLYLALLREDGVLDRGFCQTATEQLTAEEVLAVLPDLEGFDGVVLDANLSEGALAQLAGRCRELGVPFALETVAYGRAPRVLAALSGCALIKPDRVEAEILTGLPCHSQEQAASCARALREKGAQAVIVSRGAEGFYFESHGEGHHVSPVPIHVVDVTGAGDALFAAAFAGLLRRLPIPQVLEAARQAAALACTSPHAVSPELSPALFERLSA